MERKREEEIVYKDAEALYIGNLNTVEFDLQLPKTGTYGSVIEWKSGHDRIISDEGKVVRPDYGKGDRTVPLYATFTYGSVSLKRTYMVRVLEKKNEIQVRKTYPIEGKTGRNQTYYLPTVTVIETQDGRVIPYAVTWEGSCERKYTATGSYTEKGVLKDTEIPVVATVEVTEKLEKEMMNRKPAVMNFPMEQVHLEGQSSFKMAQDRNCEFLLTVNDDQMLYNFRKAAGMDTLGAPEMIGWDAPDSLLRGHTTGHYLSALALCFAATGNEVIRNKAEYMIHSLSMCQQEFSHKEGFHEGFLSGYSEEQFDLLEKYTVYPKIWAPYYTLHKIFAGLLDCYEYMKNETALKIADRLGDWVYHRLSVLPHQQLCNMWALYIAGEFGGMNDVLARLYQYTKKEEHLSAARLFDNDKLFYPLEKGIDALNTLHANQHIPQIIGAMELFRATGEKRYYDIARFFWNTVIKTHTYAIGGTGEGEMFHGPNEIAGKLTTHTAESCASYNMLKLTSALYSYEPKSSYMDYYERTMVNHILSSGEQKATGASTYFMSMAPGFTKEYDCENSCCHGTGLENHFKYAKDVFYQDAENLYINLFVPSRVIWKEKKVTIAMFVEEERPGELQLTIEGSASFGIRIRKPYWCVGTPVVIINDQICETYEEKDGYIGMTQEWHNKDCIKISYPCDLRIEQAPDDDSKGTVMYGPYVLAARTESKEFMKIQLRHHPVSEVFERREKRLSFLYKEDVIEFIPLYQVQYEPYQVYMEIQE